MIVLINTFEIYLVVNALLFNNSYISQVFNSKEEEKFFTFISRSLERFIYSCIICLFIEPIFMIFMPSLNSLLFSLKTNQSNLNKMKFEIQEQIRKIKKSYTNFMIISLILGLVLWYYIFCFNNIYPCTKTEWIKSSVVTFIMLQMMTFGESLLFGILRYLAIKCRSEGLLNLGELFG